MDFVTEQVQGIGTAALSAIPFSLGGGWPLGRTESEDRRSEQFRPICGMM